MTISITNPSNGISELSLARSLSAKMAQVSASIAPECHKLEELHYAKTRLKVILIALPLIATLASALATGPLVAALSPSFVAAFVMISFYIWQNYLVKLDETISLQIQKIDDIHRRIASIRQEFLII